MISKFMRIRLARWLLAILLPLVGISAFAAAKRVISFAPHATELAYAAGLGDSLIAASDYSDYPLRQIALNESLMARHQP